MIAWESFSIGRDSPVNADSSDFKLDEKKSEYGENKLEEAKRKTNFQKFIDQFKDAMIIILLIAATISFGLAETSSFIILYTTKNRFIIILSFPCD